MSEKKEPEFKFDLSGRPVGRPSRSPIDQPAPDVGIADDANLDRNPEHADQSLEPGSTTMAAAQNVKEQNIAYWALAAFVVLGAIALNVGGETNQSSTSSTSTSSSWDAADTSTCKEDKIGAFVMSQQFVPDYLKAPATAVFPYINEPGISVESSSGCRYHVRAFVDAQNGFGAQIRTWYDADLTYLNSSDQWRLDSIQMDGQ